MQSSPNQPTLPASAAPAGFVPPPFRSGFHAEDSGAYDQLIKVMNPVIDPGDMLELHHYFVGYGTILAAKALCYPSGELFEASKSRTMHNLSIEMRGDGFKINGWGSMEDTPGENFAGIVISFSGVGFGPQEGPGTSFIDEQFPKRASDKVPRLITEFPLGGNPPVLYRFKTRKKIKPGKYFVEFNFTYNDGKAWKSTTKKVEFHVRNVLERFAVPLGVLAAILLVLNIANVATRAVLDIARSASPTSQQSNLPPSAAQPPKAAAAPPTGPVRPSGK